MVELGNRDLGSANYVETPGLERVVNLPTRYFGIGPTVGSIASSGVILIH
jgi:hypothetical protein